jgi:hypothetical protein
MLITRRSRHDSPHGIFHSRFREGGSESPLVRYRRLREALYGRVIYVSIQTALLGAVIALGLTLLSLFRRHGAGLEPAYVRGTLAVVAILALLMMRRIVGQVRQLLVLRRDLRSLREEVEGGDSR